jgi:hypothetical protein
MYEFLNCGLATPEPETRTVALDIWDGATVYRFVTRVSDLSALLQERTEQIPITQRFGLFETGERGRARLSGTGKSVVFRFAALPGRAFSIARAGIAGVARTAARAPGEQWIEANVSEMIPRRGMVRMGVRT